MRTNKSEFSTSMWPGCLMFRRRHVRLLSSHNACHSSQLRIDPKIPRSNVHTSCLPLHGSMWGDIQNDWKYPPIMENPNINVPLKPPFSSGLSHSPTAWCQGPVASNWRSAGRNTDFYVDPSLRVCVCKRIYDMYIIVYIDIVVLYSSIYIFLHIV